MFDLQIFVATIFAAKTWATQCMHYLEGYINRGILGVREISLLPVVLPMFG